MSSSFWFWEPGSGGEKGSRCARRGASRGARALEPQFPPGFRGFQGLPHFLAPQPRGAALGLLVTAQTGSRGKARALGISEKGELRADLGKTRSSYNALRSPGVPGEEGACFQPRGPAGSRRPLPDGWGGGGWGAAAQAWRRAGCGARSWLPCGGTWGALLVPRICLCPQPLLGGGGRAFPMAELQGRPLTSVWGPHFLV